MIKRIVVADVRIGMFIHEFCGSWLEHPFWRSRFALDDPVDLAAIRVSAIRELLIDTDRGLDVAGSLADEDAVADTDVAEADQAPAALRGVEVRESGQAGFAEECARARRVLKAGKAVVESMFQESRLGRVVEMDAVHDLVESITASIARNATSLISLARLKTADEYTYLHSVSVCSLMVALARELRFDEPAVRQAGVAGLLHDMGKAMVPLEILNKPGKLTDAEFAVIRRHPRAGAEIVRRASDCDPVTVDVCLHHHEKLDGTGYPDALDGNTLSLFARMGAVCDIYDAITSNRPYKSGWDPSMSLRRMEEWTRGHLDRAVFHAFVKCVGIYPVGSLVRLASERIAVVTEQNAGASLAPRVKAFYALRSGSRIPTETIDLAHRSCKDRIIAVEPREKWNFADLDAMWAGG